MKRFLLILTFFMLFVTSFSQKITSKICYNTAKDHWSGISYEMYFDLYEPVVRTDTLRPLVITLFGGGFVAGNRAYADMEAFGRRFAEDGFVAASIDYRLMPLKKAKDDNLQRAGFLAAQDLAVAIRFFKANWEKYGIDTNRIVLLGESAGAVAILHELFMGEESRPRCTREPEDLGPMRTAGADSLLKHSTDVACAVALWGCVLDTNIIKPDAAKVPLLLIHGRDDKILPYNSGRAFGLQRLTYVYGSGTISKRLTNVGYPHEYHLFDDEKHAFYFDFMCFYHLNNLKFDLCYNLALKFIRNCYEGESER